MKKKRFYNNKKRGQKWTEEVRGRKISFADKYIEPTNSSDKFDNRRPTVKKPVFTRDNFERLLRRLIVAVICVSIISVGYTIMDTNMIRKSMPEEIEAEDNQASINDIDIDIDASEIIPLSMDGGIMLDAVIDELQQGKFTSAVFDLKRSDGTIGYHSMLATIETYNAVSSPASNLEKSIATLKANDILPIARICCYKDNIAPIADKEAAIVRKGKPYKDEGGNTYLNPNSSLAYSYIKEIIQETAIMGIPVFVLDYCDLPDGIEGNYNDGFEALSKKLYRDIGDGIKLVEARRITIKAGNAKAIRKELDEKLDKERKSTVYFISTKNKAATKSILDKMGNVNYIIAQ